MSEHKDIEFKFLLDLYPDPNSEEFKRAQENMRRYSALLLRIYTRLRTESELTRLGKGDNTEDVDGNQHLHE